MTGTVSDAASDDPLPGILVSILDTDAETVRSSDVTDKDGVFLLSNVTPGSYILVADRDEFSLYRTELELLSDEQRVIDIQLTAPTVELDPYVVSASRYEEKALKSPASVTVVSSRQLARDAVPSVVASLRNIPGVDVMQAGMGRYLVAVRGFNNAFGSATYAMVDNRESFNPGMALIGYSRLPIEAIDLDRIEVIRGPASALYGPGVAHGVIHFLSKDPFMYPGTTISVGVGSQALLQGSIRHAGVFKEKLGYKITASFMQAEDWKLDPDDEHDAEILDRIEPKLKDLDDVVVRVIDGRDYDVYAMKLNGQVQYRFSDQTRITAYAGYSKIKQILNATLGEIQADGPGGVTAQLQFESGPFYAQAYGQVTLVDGNNWFYPIGDLMYENSSQIDLQARYNLDFLDDRFVVNVGADYKLTTPRTYGTVMGRFEDEDSFSLYGGYLFSSWQISEKVNLTASGRIDYMDATEKASFSPRIGLVVQPTPENAFRLTYNRATSRATATDYFGDIFVPNENDANVRFLGSAKGFTFPDPRQTTNFYVPGRDPGIGMATARAFSFLAGSVAETLAPDDPAALTDFLKSKRPQINGVSEGIMTYGRDENGEPIIVQSLQDIEGIGEETTQTIELGYKGILGGRFVVGIDGYYTKKSDFLFSHFITPFVEIPTEILSNDLRAAVMAAFTDEELAPYGIDVGTLASTYADSGTFLGDTTIGIMEPDQTYDSETGPEMILAHQNAGNIDYFGVDVSIDVVLNEYWSGYANFSWFSENYFNEYAIGLPGSGYVISMNTPKEKFRAGVVYRTRTGFTMSGGLRYVGRFTVADGRNYKGVVEAYTLFDVGLMYDFPEPARGLNLAITVQNVFDNQHREYIGVPTIGRLISSRLTYTF